MEIECIENFTLLKEKDVFTKRQLFFLLYTCASVFVQVVYCFFYNKLYFWILASLFVSLYAVLKLIIENVLCLRKIMNFWEVLNIKTATHVWLHLPDSNGKKDIVEIYRKEEMRWVMLYQTKYMFDDDLNKFVVPNFYRNRCFGYFQTYKPLSSIDVCGNMDMFGKNVIEMVCPSIFHVFVQKIISPSTIFNAFFMLLCIAEGYRMSIAVSVVITIFDILVATFNEIYYNKTFKSYETKPILIKVMRDSVWVFILTSELVPGDLVAIDRSWVDKSISCDILLTDGCCLVDEAILTGESVPQIKESIETQDAGQLFNIDVYGKSHVLYSGTNLLNLTAIEKPTNKNNKTCSGVVLRTGFYTDKGKLFRSLLHSIHNENLNDTETYAYIFILFIFGLAISLDTWFKRIYTPDVNKMLLLVHCIKLIVASIPIDLSSKLLLFLQRLNASLRLENIFTMRMSKMLQGGKVDVCFFDKTGTLTEERVVVNGVGALDFQNITQLKDLPLNNVITLIGCTSVFTYDDKIVGDPIDTAIIEAFSCSIFEDHIESSSPFSLSLATQIKFPFESSLRRMASVVTVQHSSFARGYQYFAVVKGAPESLKNMFQSLPPEYDHMNTSFSADGFRVIAIGYKIIPKLESNKVAREEIECNLIFGGFLLSNTKIKVDTKSTITSLRKMTLDTVMISGDNPFTACYVSRSVGISEKNLLILTVNENNELLWINGANDESHNFTQNSLKSLSEDHQFCITGVSITQLRKLQNYDKIMRSLIPYIKVYARVDPHQKEYIIKYYQSNGLIVLMCGDGANDIGALRSSDVGLAMLNTAKKTHSPQPTKPEPSNPVLRLRKSKKPSIAQVPKHVSEEDTTQPGDASIAAPFTLKGPEMSRCLSFMKFCMCSLSYYQHILILSTIYSLTYVYMQATHYAEGLVFSDRQQSFYGIISLLIYYATFNILPSSSLPRRKPLSSLFHPYILLTIIVQSVIHVYTIYHIANHLGIQFPSTDPLRSVTETAFLPSAYNTALYYYEFFLMLAVYLVNYNGAPFSTPLSQNTMFISILMSLYGLSLALLTNMIPSLSDSLQLVQLHSSIVYPFLVVVGVNLVTVFIADRFLYFICVFLCSPKQHNIETY